MKVLLEREFPFRAKGNYKMTFNETSHENNDLDFQKFLATVCSLDQIIKTSTQKTSDTAIDFELTAGDFSTQPWPEEIISSDNSTVDSFHKSANYSPISLSWTLRLEETSSQPYPQQLSTPRNEESWIDDGNYEYFLDIPSPRLLPTNEELWADDGYDSHFLDKTY